MRLIDADALIDFLDVGHLRHSSELCYSEIEVANLLLQAPTVEAKPVVHCKDCTMLQYCKFGQYLGLEGYCSRGEKHD